MNLAEVSYKRDILGHWLWAVPILLIVAALAIRQIDLYPPGPDEFFSMHDAGWLVNSPYSPIDILQSLQKHSSNNTPGYFMLLSAWGSLTTYDIALARVLTIFTGLLSLAMAYRLARDFVAPTAGLFALVIVASSAFYNFYFAQARMYPLYVLTSGIVLWLYLRIIHQQKQVKRRDCLVLGAAVFALVNLHAFSATFLLALGIYHLLAAPKNQRWLWVAAAVVVAVLLFSPWIRVLVSQGIDLTIDHWGAEATNGQTAVRAWLTVKLSDQPLLLLLSVVGLAVGIWTKTIQLKPYLILFVPSLIAMALIAQFTDLIAESNMRYLLGDWFPFVLFIVAGLYALYCFRKWLALLIIFWVMAGLVFQMTADWRQYLAGRTPPFSLSPVQVISRLALQAEQKPIIISYRSTTYRLQWERYIDYSQREHYFDRRGLVFKLVFKKDDGPAWFEEYVGSITLIKPSIWVFYQTGKTSSAQIAEIDAIMHKLGYEACDTPEIGIDTVILQYMWQPLDCQPPHLLTSHQTDSIDYQFYGAELDTAHSKLFFNDQWTAREGDALENYKMSYQLISADWNNPAQLDLPLVHEGELRLFSIDITDVPAGSYRLMAILYDVQSGERQTWLNGDSGLPGMLTLTEIDIP